jgi:hypothetical protein
LFWRVRRSFSRWYDGGTEARWVIALFYRKIVAQPEKT